MNLNLAIFFLNSLPKESKALKILYFLYKAFLGMNFNYFGLAFYITVKIIGDR